MSPLRARFGGVDIVARDMRASVAFYRELGVDIPDDEVWIKDGVMHHWHTAFDGEHGMDIDSDALTRSYAPDWPAAAGVVITFRTESRADVDALHDHMVGLGHPSQRAPFDAFWGARYAVLVDPDGNHVSLMSPMDKSLGGPPPDL
ncbi:MAG TPA: VOC family protein [Acidimicrobiales bacterium]|nr:VOC family protein [Acidimicrobiales bacterium]